MFNQLKKAVVVLLTLSTLLGAFPLPKAAAASGWITASQTSFDGNASETNTAYITWGVSALGQNNRGVVYVRANDEQEKLFAYQDDCSGQNCPAPWINPLDGQTAVYTFTLYNFDCVTGVVGERLASVTLTVSPRGGGSGGGSVTPTTPSHASGNITANPNPCSIASGADHCVSYITWSTQNVPNGAQVFVTERDNRSGVTYYNDIAFSGNQSSCSGQNCPAPWIRANRTYTFVLYALNANGSRGAELDRVTVTATGGTPVGNPTLVFSPSSATISSCNGTAAFSVLYDPDGATGPQPTQNVSAAATYNSPNNSIAYPEGSGVFRGTQSGSVTVTAMYAGLTAAATLTVNCTPIGGNPTLTISPSSQSVSVGQSVSFVATYDPDGATGPQPTQNVTLSGNWSVSNPSIAVVGGAGLIRGVAAGNSQVTVQYNGLTATASLTVTGEVCTINCPGTPNAETLAATNVTKNAATLNGRVNPNNSSNVAYRFEYGWSSGLGATTVFQTLGVSGNTATNVSASITNLIPNTTYYFRVVAMTASGQMVYGQILSFTTPQDVCVDCGGQILAQTNAATNVTITSATLNGQIDPAGNSNVSYRFEYGTSPSYLGYQTAYQPAGSGNGYRNLSAGVSNLAPNTTYYFRIVAITSSGQVVNGNVLSFTTQTSQTTAPTAVTYAATGISENTATLNGRINPNGTATCRFDYGTNPNSLGQQMSCGTLSGSYEQSVYATVSGLQSNTTYYFRVVAVGSQTVYGQVLSFTTGGGYQGSAPLVETNSATNIQTNSATLNGRVNPNGNPTTWRFEWGTSQNLGNTVSGFQNAGSGNSYQNVIDYLNGLQCNTTYYFRLTAQNAYGTTNGSILSFTTNSCGGSQSAPSVQTNSATNVQQNYATLNGQVMQQSTGYFWNSGNTQVWFEYGTSPFGMSYMTASQNLSVGSSWVNFSQNVSNLQPNTTYYFRAVASNGYGTTYGQVLSFTTAFGDYCQYGNCNYGSQPTVVTQPASYSSQNSAVLYGQVNPNNGLTTAWFEYGQSPSLGLRTPDQPVGSGNYQQQISYPISGLQPGTTYYFRAVAQNQNGTAYGQILSFQTQQVYYPQYPVNPVVYQPQTIQYPVYQPVVQQIPINVPVYQYQTQVVRQQVATGAVVANAACVTLVPTLNVTQLKANQEFIYTITYRNGCNFDLANGMLQVALPVEVDFINASNPYFTREGNALTFNLGAVPMNAQVAINVHGVVKSTVKPGDNLIFGAIFNFSDLKGRFQSIVAYLTAFIIEGDGTGIGVGYGANIGAALSAFFASGWFTFLLLVLILVIILWMILNRTRRTAVSVDGSGLRNLRVE